MPAMPLLAVPLAHALTCRSVRAAAATALALQTPITLAIWQHPRWLWPADDGNRALQALGPLGRAYAAGLPDVRADGAWAALPAILIGAAVTVALILIARREHPLQNRPHGLGGEPQQPAGQHAEIERHAERDQEPEPRTQ
jgi:hypothetical protein